MLNSVGLSSVSFDADDTLTVMKYPKSSCMLGADAVQSVLFRAAGPDLFLLLLNLSSLSMQLANFPSKSKTTIIVPHGQLGFLHDSESFAPLPML